MNPHDPKYTPTNPHPQNPYYPNHPGQPGQLAEPAKPTKIMVVWRVIATVYALIAAGLILYWEFGNTGLPDTVCQWQAQLLNSDSCYIALNFCISLLILLVPLFIVKILIEKVTGVKLVNPKFRG